MDASLKCQAGMHFVCTNGPHQVSLDATIEHGGSGLGPSPKEVLLDAMMGCTAMDVVSMLKKMRQEITSFDMKIHAEKTKEHPVHFKTAHLSFIITGKVEAEKAIKAVSASLTKYCEVNYIVSKSCHITAELTLNGTSIYSAPVVFEEPKE